MAKQSKTALRKELLQSWRAGSEDVMHQLCEMDGFDPDDPLERDFCEACAEYEKDLFEKHGWHVSANRTRRVVKKKGVIGCIETQVLGPHRPQGLKLLADNERLRWTSECTALKYQNRFSPRVIAAAHKALPSSTATGE
jgi:hypothetical protein